MKKYIIALDEGTTSARSVLIDAEGKIAGVAQREFAQHYPHPGWVEHDPQEILSAQLGTMTELLAANSVDAGDIDSIGDVIVSDLSDGDYTAAFDAFADQCGYYLDGYINGFPFNFGKNLLICLIIGIVAGVVVAFVLKGQLKTVRKQNQANVYVKPGSMQVTVRNDFFLYREVSKSKKESSSSSGSGSSRSTGGGSF